MITKKEIEAVELSPTKRDFYQIWAELLDTAGKLSNRYDPASANEADPGVVLLKVLTAIADKLNYTIDKNILEAFMPSASQEESMRKLCDMLGYTMKYYRSATCPVKISYVGSDYDLKADGYSVVIPRFTNLKNEDEDVNYVTLTQDTLGGDKTSMTVDALEGEHVSYDKITRDQLDDDNRYYLPEAQIAENGIFLADASSSKLVYEKVGNLNSQSLGTRCWKFGYDSKKDAPYIEFPSDISALIGDGISFDFIRTNGSNGNIAVGKLCKLSASGIALVPNDASDDSEISCDDSWFSVINTSASMNGSDKETIDDAYSNYKKTIGTFDTLVTCRDYMNKIWSLTEGDVDGSASTTPLVSNVIVSDIRDDVNESAKVVTFDENGRTTKTTRDPESGISNFDLKVYPFKRVAGLNSATEFENSFNFTTENLPEIESGIEDCKTMSHSVKTPASGEMALAKDVIEVNAKITATDRLTPTEQSSVLAAAKGAIYKNFNMRKVDFGEEISDDMISKAILNSDSRIKNVWLNTKHSLAFQSVSNSTYASGESYDRFYRNALTKNILAGRIPLFNYDEDFEPALNETKCEGYDLFYPADGCVTRIDAKFEPTFQGDCALLENEVVQFRAPSFKTTLTYPAYVNYYLHLSEDSGEPAKPAKMKTLKDWLSESIDGSLRVIDFLNNGPSGIKAETVKKESLAYEKAQANYIWLLKKDANSYSILTSAEFDAAETFLVLPLKAGGEYAGNFALLLKYVKATVAGEKNGETVYYSGIYRSRGVDASLAKGRLVSETCERFAEAVTVQTATSDTLDSEVSSYACMYVQNVENGEDNDFGLGIAADCGGIEQNEEYRLKNGDYLLINYTNTTTDDSGTETSAVVNKTYPAGTIIKPNFELADSATVHSNENKSWSKKTGFAFDYSIDGMFTMSANEQIEIREKVAIDLGPAEDESSSFANIFWYRVDDDARTVSASDGLKVLDFAWDEDLAEDDEGNKYYKSYTLKEGEYFFYTDKNKNDLAYYGNGTKISRSSASVNLRRYIEADDDTSVDDILQYGLSASIPWISKTFSSSTGGIEIREYQYVNLTDGCWLKGGSLDSLTGKWQQIANPEAVGYKLSSKADSWTPLTGIAIEGDAWEARSRLQLDLGPKKAQTLSEFEKIEIYKANETDADSGYPIWTVGADGEIKGFSLIKTFYGNDGVSLKSSAALQSSSEMTILSEKSNCRFKAVKLVENSTLGETGTSFGNYGDGMTSASLNGSKDDSAKSITLSLAVPEGDFGLLMVYAKVASDSRGDKSSAFFSATAEGKYIKEFAGEEGYYKEISWTEDGLKVLKIDSQAAQIALTAAEGVKLSLVFSNLDVVPSERSWNEKLAIDADGYAEILAALKKYDGFWYNCLLDAGEMIDFNSDDEDDDMKNVAAWYDQNNVCSKFFIAQIDRKKLDAGIMIDSASKRG